MPSIALIKASNNSGSAARATLTAGRSIGSYILTVNTTINYPASFIAEIGTIDPSTNRINPATSQVVRCTLTNPTTITINSWAPGYSDLGNTSGDVVIIRPTTDWSNNLAQTIEVSHNDNGTLKDGVVSTAAVANKAVTLPKLDGGSTAGVLVTDASGVVASIQAFKRKNNTAAPVDIGQRTIILHGWVGHKFTAAASAYTGVIPFGVTFKEPPIVMAQYGGDQSSGTVEYPSTVGLKRGTAAASGATTTQMNIAIWTLDGSNWSTGNNVYAQWTAIGELAD